MHSHSAVASKSFSVSCVLSAPVVEDGVPQETRRHFSTPLNSPSEPHLAMKVYSPSALPSRVKPVWHTICDCSEYQCSMCVWKACLIFGNSPHFTGEHLLAPSKSPHRIWPKTRMAST